MGEPRFAVLDVVEVRDHPGGSASGPAAHRGIVVQVREYPSGTYVYALAAFDDEDATEVGGLHDEAALEPTGERESLDRFRLPAPFQHREIVDIAVDYVERRIAGRSGVIEDELVEEGDGPLFYVWIEDLGEGFAVPASALTATGQRLPPPPAKRGATSTRVANDGQVLGHDSYAIVDEVGRYL